MPLWLLFCWFGITAIQATPALQVQALVDLYNTCGGPQWNKSTNWNPTNPNSDPCSQQLRWYGIDCNGYPNPYVEHVLLGGNNLRGTIPDSIENLAQLTELDLSRNFLTGTMPDTVYRLPYLNLLQLNDNGSPTNRNITGLQGTISPLIGNLQALTNLYLSHNSLTGGIPGSLYTITALRLIDLTGNQLTGSLNSSVGNWMQLVNFNLGSNKLSGTIPPEIGNLTNLLQIQLTSNQFTGTIPPSVCGLVNLTGLWFDSNLPNGGGLSGSIPPCLGNLTQLTNLFLSNNKLSGGIPKDLFRLTNVQQMFIGGNQLGSTIPPEISMLAPNIKEFDVSQALITGTIPPEIGELTGLVYLNLATNQLTGIIPDSLLQLTNLQQLQLQAVYKSSHTLVGTIPEGLFSLTNLNFLLLANNKLNGTLPTSFNLPNIAQLDLSINQLSGTIPDGMWKSQKLGQLYLNNNMFVGTISPSISKLPLSALTLNDNSFSGFVPLFFNNTKFGNPAGSVLKNNPFLCPIPSWAYQATGAVCTPWTVSQISPSYGDTFVDTPVNVIGSKFQQLGDSLYCTFGNSSQPATVINGTVLSCFAGVTENITRVENLELTFQSQNFTVQGNPQFVYLGVPEVISILPESGRQQGYVNVTITGSNFYDTSKWNLLYCAFGSSFVPATYINSSALSCTSPPADPGDVHISVSLDGNLTLWDTSVVFTYFEYCDGLPLACTGNGDCDTNVHPPECKCYTNFQGRICDNCVPLFFGSQCLACPDCGLNGTCNDGIKGDGLCVCDTGFYGTNCHVCPACANGKCDDGQRGSGKCKCDIMWGGKLCDSRWPVYVTAIVGFFGVVGIAAGLFWYLRIRKPKEYHPLP